MSLRIPDISQADVLNDLKMLKSQNREKDALEHQPIGRLQPNNTEAYAPYQITSIRDSDRTTAQVQNSTCQEAYQQQSFEVRV